MHGGFQLAVELNLQLLRVALLTRLTRTLENFPSSRVGTQHSCCRYRRYHCSQPCKAFWTKRESSAAADFSALSSLSGEEDDLRRRPHNTHRVRPREKQYCLHLSSIIIVKFKPGGFTLERLPGRNRRLRECWAVPIECEKDDSPDVSV